MIGAGRLADSGHVASIGWLAGLGILAGPGIFYGEAGRRYVRIALTATDERVAEAARRLTSAPR